MPELPEVEITARLLDRALAGAEIESAIAPGINALKTFDPPLAALEGQRFLWVRRRGKLFVLDLDVVAARVSTFGHEVVDAFYVRDTHTGGKVTDPDRIRQISDMVVHAINTAPATSAQPG